MQHKWHPFFLWVYAIVAGAIIAVAFLPLFSKWLIWVALVPFFGLTLLKINRRRDLFFFGWLSGFAALGIYLLWFFDAVPLTWIGILSLPLSYGLVALAWFLAAGFGAIWFGLFLVLTRMVARTPLQNVIVMIALWPVLEYLRTVAFSFNPFLFGAGHIFGDHISFLLLSYALAGSETLRQFASIFGSYGLSIIVIIPNVLVFSFFNYLFSSRLTIGSHWPRLLLLVMLGLIILYVVFISDRVFTRAREGIPNNTITIAVANTRFYPEDWVGNAEGYFKRAKNVSNSLLRKALDMEPSPSIIVMPEGIPTALDAVVDARGTGVMLSEINKKLGAAPYRLVIDSDFSKHISGARTKNTVSLIDNAIGMRGIYEKRFLMPWGEYLPSVFLWGVRLLGASSWLVRQQEAISYVPGNSDGVFATPVGKIGILTCSELLSPSLVRQTALGGASMLIFPASDGILRGSPLLRTQNLAMAQIRAAEVAKPIIYASNSGQSFVVDADGRVVWISTDDANGVFSVRVAANDKATFAARYEGFLLFIFGIAVLSVAAYNYVKKKTFYG